MNDSPFQLTGKRILVTGSSSGLGRAIAIEVSRMGAQVIITGRNETRLQETFEQLEGSGHIAIAGDLSDADFPGQLVAKIDGKLDGIVLNAGIMKLLPIQFLTDEWIETMSNVNYKAPVKITRDLVKAKKLNKGASFVFITSINGGVVGTKAQSMYASTKAGLTGFVKALAVDLGPRQIRLNCIAPGMVLTEGSKGVYETLTEEEVHEDLKKYPLGRYGQPEDIAYAAVYLLSNASSWMTGTTMVIDGGFTSQ